MQLFVGLGEGDGDDGDDVVGGGGGGALDVLCVGGGGDEWCVDGAGAGWVELCWLAPGPAARVLVGPPTTGGGA